MEIVKRRFASFMIVISFMCCKTAAYEAPRIREQFQILEDGIYFVRKDIRTLFERTDKLNLSSVEGCGSSLSRNKTSCSPVMNHDERQDMVNSSNVLVKYQSLMKAFVAEKKINRELQDQIHSIEDLVSARDREVQVRLQSVDDIISEIRKNMTLENTARELKDNDRDRELRGQLQSIMDTISANKKVANETDRDLQSRLQSMVDTISAAGKVASARDRKLQDQLRSMRESIEGEISDIYRDLLNKLTSLNFITTINDRMDKTALVPVKTDITTDPIFNTNCSTVPESGVYTLYLELIMSPVSVYCDQDTDGGGWLVFMRRQDGSVDFTRSWSEYKHGFGCPDGEFWAGNELIHKLTRERPFQFRIDMEDFDGNSAFAMYEEFQVGAEEDKYRLHVRGYSGTAGDSLIDVDYAYNKHAGMQFSTFDSDNDNTPRYHCAADWKGGWWYNSCFAAKLNAPYSQNKTRLDPKGILWYSWKGFRESLKRVEMKIRKPS